MLYVTYFSAGDDMMDDCELMGQWFALVNDKNDLVRKETDLMYRIKQQELEDQHSDVEYELRCLIEKPGESVYVVHTVVG